MLIIKDKINKISLSLGLVVVFIAYVIVSNWKNGKSIADNIGTIPTAPATPLATVGKYKDGTYTGSVVDVYYGNVQVQTIVLGGNITGVEFLQYPSKQGNSRKINSVAMPILKSEVIKSQSGNVDMVSGATQTSKGFLKSLSNALAQAVKW